MVKSQKSRNSHHRIFSERYKEETLGERYVYLEKKDSKLSLTKD